MPTKITDTNIAATGVVAGSYTSANITVNESGQIISASSGSVSPRITNIQIADSSYLAIDDTAVSTSGGYIIITGSGFTSGCQVIIGTLVATSISFINSTTIHAQVPAQSSGTYTVYLTNTDGSVAIRVNGLNYSATPSWQTTSPLTSGVINTPISLQLQATSNTSVVYQLQTGSTLPSGLTLSSSGLLTGTVTGLTTNTTYNFTVVAIDQENQDTPQAFSITIQINDPYFEYTTLLLPGNGTNGAQNNTFLDGSTNNFTITRNGNTTQGTFSPFSQTGWGNYFDGSGDYLSAPASDSFAFGTGDFTVEMWIYPTAIASGDVGLWYVDQTGGLVISLLPTTGYLEIGSRLTSYDLQSTYKPPLNAWTHVVCSRVSGTGYIFANGQQVATGSLSSKNYLTTVTGSSVTAGNFGNNPAGSAYFQGYISGLRVVKGSGVTSVTVPTAPLTAISGTSLLTCQSNRFIDNSTNNFTITVNGDTRVVAFSPFAPPDIWSAVTYGGSGYFDGTGDYLTGASTSGQLGAGDFTIEAWVYSVSRITNYPCIFSNYSSFTTGSFSIFAGHASANTAKYQVPINGTFPAIVSTSDIVYNAWTHVAVVRNGSGSNNVTLYINGVANGTATSTATLNGTSGTCWIGASGDSLSTTTLNGYISGVRIVKGTAVYTSAFTPPSAPPTAITNTSLLLNFTNAGIYDATSKNDLETVGNAQISTTQSKWGGSSMYFDGTGDYLITPASQNFVFGTGDFTIECWLYLTALGINDGVIIEHRSTGVTNNGFVFNTSRSGGGYVLNFYTDGASNLGSTVLSLNAWNHVAVTRSGTTVRLFSNGTVSSTFTKSNNFSNSPNPTIGQSLLYGSSNLTGYIQDLRITKGYARYTANFTAPTAAFQTL